MTLSAHIRAGLPEALHLPDAIADAMDWLEAQGHGGTFTHGGDPYVSLYPPAQQDTPGASYVLFHFEAGPPLHAPPPEVTERVASIAKIAGDGGTLALWADESDTQRLVVFNHGHPHVLTSDPLVALQFLALGYPEPGAITDATLSPAEYAAQEMYDPPVLPDAFRTYLQDTHSLTLPDRASDLGITIPAETAPDPIRDWLDKAMPEPDISELPGMTPENPYRISPELREALGDEGMTIMRESFKYIIEDE